MATYCTVALPFADMLHKTVPTLCNLFHCWPSVRFRDERDSDTNTWVSQVVAIIENDTPKCARNQRTRHTIMWNVTKQFDTPPLLSNDVDRVGSLQVTFQDIVVLLSFCKINPVKLSSIFINRFNFYATMSVRHHIVTRDRSIYRPGRCIGR